MEPVTTIFMKRFARFSGFSEYRESCSACSKGSHHADARRVVARAFEELIAWQLAHELKQEGTSRTSRTYFIYRPMIGASSRLVCSGTTSGRVMIAVASASLHGHVRAPAIRPTASAIACCAVRAF